MLTLFGLTTAAKLKEARDAAIQMRFERDNARTACKAEKARAMKSGRLASELLTERDAARNILREINALETPACASIGRRMAAKAREGLPEFVTSEREAA